MNMDVGIYLKQPSFMPPFPANNKLSPCTAQVHLVFTPIPRREDGICVTNETILGIGFLGHGSFRV